MKKYVYLFTVLLVFFYSCGDDSSTTTPPVTPNIEVESNTLAVSTELEKICTMANGYLILVYNNVSIPAGVCPEVTVNQQSKTITVDYGSTPCVSSVDSARRSGKFTINYYTNVSPDSIAGKVTFTNYRVYKTAITTDTAYLQIAGDDDIGGKKVDASNYRVSYVMNNNFYRDNGTSGNALLNLIINANTGNIGILSDDVFSITGSGTLLNSGTTYAYNIYDTANPLMIYGDCRYPKSGKIKLSANSADVILDFYPNGGGCDAILSILKNSVTVTVDLSKYY